MTTNKKKSIIKTLEKHRLIGRTPHPAIPFIITLCFYLLHILSKTKESYFSSHLPTLIVISLIFSILHLIFYKILGK